MTTPLVTARLELFPLTHDEAECIVADDRSNQNWSPGYPREDDRDIATMFLNRPEPREPWFGPLQIARRDTGLIIGGIGFFRPPDAEGTVTLGYGIAPEAEGKGFTTEALQALLRFGFSTGRVRRVLADTALDNRASQRVLEKCGMARVASDEHLHYYEIRQS